MIFFYTKIPLESNGGGGGGNGGSGRGPILSVNKTGSPTSIAPSAKKNSICCHQTRLHESKWSNMRWR